MGAPLLGLAKSIYYTVNSTKESTAQCLSFEWSLIRPGFPVGEFCYVYMVVPNFKVLKKALKCDQECHGISVYFPGCSKTIPCKSSMISCHLQFLELSIFQTNFHFPRRFEKAGFHCISIVIANLQ